MFKVVIPFGWFLILYLLSTQNVTLLKQLHLYRCLLIFANKTHFKVPHSGCLCCTHQLMNCKRAIFIHEYYMQANICLSHFGQFFMYNTLLQISSILNYQSWILWSMYSDVTTVLLIKGYHIFRDSESLRLWRCFL